MRVGAAFGWHRDSSVEDQASAVEHPSPSVDRAEATPTEGHRAGRAHPAVGSSAKPARVVESDGKAACTEACQAAGRADSVEGSRAGARGCVEAREGSAREDGVSEEGGGQE